MRERRSIRLQKYDYSQSGSYFVTVCTQHRECLLGDIVNEDMVLNVTGKMVLDVWAQLPMRFPTIELDEFIIMPNHVHGIINIQTGISETGAASSAPTLGQIVRMFKSVSAIAVNKILNRKNKPLWQRNYYERIIRNEEECNRTREYIFNNPAQWASDENNITFL